MTKANIIKGNIEYIAGKTKDNKPRVARVPLTEKAKAILAKYDLPDNQLLPFISEVKYNKYLKDVFKLDKVKLTRNVTIPDPKTRKSAQKSIADLASSHMARRVFISSLYHKGVKDSIIASMSGHVENSKAFSRYYSVSEADQKEAIKLIG
jgi:integrase